MIDMSTLIELLTTIFLLMMAGYIMTKLGILPVSVRGPLTDLVIDFVLPCNIIVSFLIEFNREIMISCFAVAVISLGIELFTLFAGTYLYPGTGKDQHTVLKYATVVSNAGFLGSPIVQGLYGDQGLLYASIYLIPVRIVMWSYGISCFSGKKGKGVLKKTLTHPCIVAVMIGVLLMVTQVTLPAGIEKTLRSASNCNTALCMIVIGNILAEVRFRDVLCKETFWFCVVRLLLIPLVVFAACTLAGAGRMVTEVSAVLAGMPAPATAAILASKYHGDEKLAVKLVFMSTVLSLVTIPALCIFMGYF